MGNKPIYTNGNVGIVYFDECDNLLLCISIFLKIFISCIINARHYVVLRFKITSTRNKKIFLYLLSLLLSLSLSFSVSLTSVFMILCYCSNTLSHVARKRTKVHWCWWKVRHWLPRGNHYHLDTTGDTKKSFSL